MKILHKQYSDALKKELKKMCKRNRKIYLKNIREDSLGWISFDHWLSLQNLHNPTQNLSNKRHQIAKCEPLPNLSKIEGTFE